MQQFLVDANVFVAAIKNPGKKARTLDMVLELISNDGIHPASGMDGSHEFRS